MAEEKKTTKKTTTRKPRTKKTTEEVVTNNDAVVAELNSTLINRDMEISELKVELKKIKEENDLLRDSLNEKSEKLDGVQKVAKNQYAFIARYDNIQLEGITLNNLKCVIYECDANSRDEAMGLFDAQLKSTMNIDDKALNAVKAKLFGSKMTIENKIVLKSDISVGELS